VAAAAVDESRILTLPNVISLIRLACVPLFLWLLFGPQTRRMDAAYLLGALGASDWVDGYIARHFGQVSTLGKVLDPIADRILLGVGIVAIMIDGSAPVWLGTAVILREVLVSVAVMALAAMGARRIDVQWVGKAGTLCLMVAFPLFMVGNSPDASWQRIGEVSGWCFALPGLILSWYAAATYVPIARRALAEGRVGLPADDAAAANVNE
jgi:cardiolipin synthase